MKRLDQPGAIVIGGGIAGIASALRLADRGVRVLLLEASRRLGGRATSHVDPQTGQELDNCQHVTMGACTAYNGLLQRLGMGDAIDWTDAQIWLDGVTCNGDRKVRASRIAPGALPPPFHYAESLATARFLSALDKAAIAGAMGPIAAARREAWQGRTFLEFLEHAAQPPSAIHRFWAPVVVSACNLEADRVSASPALKVFQQGLLAGPAAARIGVPRVPLGRLYARVADELGKHGGRVAFGARAERVREIDNGVEVRLAAGSGQGAEIEAGAGALIAPAESREGAAPPGRLLRAGAAVIAVPPSRVLGLLDGPSRAALRALEDLEHSAIIGIHLRADRPVLSVPHAVLVGRETQWVFRKDPSGRRLQGVISAAPERVLAMSEDALARMVWEDIAACIPSARDARPEWWRVIKSRQATFAATPAFEAVRPAPGPILAGGRVTLAGDYTRTGWPATMESAARSGMMAADAVASMGD